MQEIRKLRGRAAAMAAYDGHKGPVIMQSVEAQICDELRERLTGREYGLVMSAVNAAYHNGRTSHGGLDLCDDCVWLPWGGNNDDGQLVPIDALRHIVIGKADAMGNSRYTLDYTEGQG